MTGLLLAGTGVVCGQVASFEVVTRMQIDVDGAPNAYGPPGKPALDYLLNAHVGAKADGKIVGFLTEDDRPTVPVAQGPGDPFPGYYISTTGYVDKSRPNPRDPRRYVDASRINYVVQGTEARRRGARLGDFVAVYSKRTKKAVYGIVGDSGNASGAEGSLHLLQELGYPFKTGKTGTVEQKEIVIRFFPGSNPARKFFTTEAELDAEAARLRLSKEFGER